MNNTRWLLTYGFLIIIASVCFTYFWVDIPLVEWAHAHELRQYKWLHVAQQIPEIFPYAAFLIVLMIGIRSCYTQPKYVEKALLCASLSYILVNFLTDIFKIIFARTWPATWTNNNPSWLTDNIYGFFWFIDNPGYRSFPSGHTSATFAVVITLCYFYPKFRWLGAAACTLVMLGLISNYYHYLSDILAGAYLGTLTAYLTLRFYEPIARY